VYFIMPGRFPPARAYILHNDTLIGMVQPHQYFYTDVPAGHSYFMSVTPNTSALDADLEGGKTYYVKVFATPGFAKNYVYMEGIRKDTTDWNLRLDWMDNACTFVEYVPEGGAKWDAKHKARNSQRLAELGASEAEPEPLGADHGEVAGGAPAAAAEPEAAAEAA
jgi:hypothetical protein